MRRPDVTVPRQIGRAGGRVRRADDADARAAVSDTAHPRAAGLAGALLALALTMTGALALATNAAAAEPEVFRHQAPIVVEQPAPFVRLALPASVYANSRQPGLADLRVVDARGERVPFALLAPRPEQVEAAESLQPVALYALPPQRPGEAELRSPLEVQVVGERITVRRLAVAAAGQSAAAGPAPGWLFDLGERTGREQDNAPPAAVRLAWAGPAEFSAAYELAVSDDLRQWRAAGGGQLLSLDSAGGRLTQPNVPLPATGTPRFVRLRWLDPAQAPRLAAAQQVRAQRRSVVLDPPTALQVLPLVASTPVAGAAASAGTVAATVGAIPAAAPAAPTVPAATPAAAAGVAPASDAPGALVYDLGAVLPVREIDLQLPPSQRVAPVRVQGRARADEPWRDLAQTVFYRLERGGVVDRPPPLALRAHVRQLRLVPDVRTGPLPAVPLAVQAQLVSVVFAAQGTPPYRLLAGSAATTPGALPIGTLVPALDDERARLGRATLGAWSENEVVARQEERQAQWVQWRPLLLWAVLLLGVAALGAMVWRLARRPPA